MNELNNLESRLRSWTPRRPSADLESRIARSLSASGVMPERRAEGMLCFQTRPLLVCLRLAPVACAIVLSFALLRHHGGGLPAAPATNIITLAMTSNVPLLSFAQTNPVADTLSKLDGLQAESVEDSTFTRSFRSPDSKAGADPIQFQSPLHSRDYPRSTLEHNVWVRFLAAGR